MANFNCKAKSNFGTFNRIFLSKLISFLNTKRKLLQIVLGLSVKLFIYIVYIRINNSYQFGGYFKIVYRTKYNDSTLKNKVYVEDRVY